MKRILIVSLVCINVVLLGALLFEAAAPRADAQVIGGGTDYIVLTGHVGTDWDAVYVIDLASRRLAAWRLEKSRRPRLVAFGVRELTADFPAERSAR